jgi:hypothetical protein
MKVRVKLYGALSLRVPGYQHSQGIEIELAEGATVNDLCAHLEISESQGSSNPSMADKPLCALLINLF